VTDLDGYLPYFASQQEQVLLFVESSPGYMAEAEEVAPRVAALIPQARLLFVLRDPIDRLRSCFRFYKSRLHVPDTMMFEQFVGECMAFEETGQAASSHGIKPWHLRSLRRGRYEEQLVHFDRQVPAAQHLTLLYDDLRDNMRDAMRRVCAFGGISDAFYDSHSFARENVSFLAERRSIQRVAIFVNDTFEVIWRRNPTLKRKLLGLYKRVNERPLESDELSYGAELKLRDWYGPTYTLLQRLRQQP
jgi:hypothetical protein